ncbi:hypothetical protein MTR67_006377 [Solanum verrucosum]|uniref:Uncharacterized protein n=1 Tax=Solanum verrucosum TaxID=315347 RepID=A0AAF0PY58_SOLVR|nr:hypothetical protein MTR67_006377 [Solanum verrucosum]
MKIMASLPAHKKIILVGHAFGGLAISKAMETFPEKISAAVFLSLVQLSMQPPSLLRSKVLGNYHLSVEDLALATTLVRLFYLYRAEDVSKEIVLSSKRYGFVRRAFIVAAENKALTKEFSELMIEKNPPDEVKEIEGSDQDV